MRIEDIKVGDHLVISGNGNLTGQGYHMLKTGLGVTASTVYPAGSDLPLIGEVGVDVVEVSISGVSQFVEIHDLEPAASLH